jgi:PiT family inorganic phosphate transporter
MGTRITKRNQHQGFSAAMGGSIVLFSASYRGIPVSTTHTMTGCVIGAGTARRASAVRWGIAGNVAIAWVITIPCSAIVAAMFYWLISGSFILDVIALAIIGVFAFIVSRLRSRRRQDPIA